MSTLNPTMQIGRVRALADGGAEYCCTECDTWFPDPGRLTLFCSDACFKIAKAKWYLETSDEGGGFPV